jgi:hypothetical protein
MKLIPLFAALVLYACSGDPGARRDEDAGTGGALATGGATATGGRRATGGAATGGTSTGGSATGGDTSTGGTPDDGGLDADVGDAAESGTGGAPVGTGGEASTGGAGTGGDATGGQGTGGQACECSTGACCDGCRLLPVWTYCGDYVSSTTCSLTKSSQCIEKSVRILREWQHVYCSGSSAACDGPWIWWKTVSVECSTSTYPGDNGSYCTVDSATTAHCAACQ